MLLLESSTTLTRNIGIRHDHPQEAALRTRSVAFIALGILRQVGPKPLAADVADEPRLRKRSQEVNSGTA